MTSLIRLLFLNVFLIFALTNNFSMAATIKGTYYPSWATDYFPPSSINTNYFTHIFYSFLNPDETTFKFDISDSTAAVLSDFTSTLHAKNPPVKTLYSIGGGSSTVSFSSMVSNAGTRKDFISSSIEVARKYGFDGMDFDWESPQNPTEMDNFNTLLYEWRAEVQREAEETSRAPLLITAATYYAVEFRYDEYRRYSVDAINENLDFINAMCYDYHGSWEPSKTGAHALLYDPNSNLSTSYGLGSWVQAGLTPSKLVMGLPLYGRTWELVDPAVDGIGAPAVGVGPGDDGTMTYADVETFNAENNAKVVYDEETVSVYSVAGKSWIGYDDVRSVSAKVTYARNLGIGGYFFWQITGDVNWKISEQASGLWST